MLPNLLNMAMTLIGSQQFTWNKFLSTSLNSIGQDVSIYSPPICVYGQVQAVPRELFDKFGLLFQKKYLIFYISKDIMEIDRNISGDQIVFNGKTYKCLYETDWFQINGWSGVIAVQITL
jgi:hypothetical protein